MTGKISIKNIWGTSFELMVRKPVILLPFFIIAFLEALALEVIYFSARKPLSYIALPIIKKFFGAVYTHYPYNLVKLSQMVYFAQIAISIFIGVFLTAICVNMVKNIKENLPLKPAALVKNASKRYLSFFIFGIVVVASMHFLKKGDAFLISKVSRLAARQLSGISAEAVSVIFALFMFVTNVVLQVFLVLTVPIIVIRRYRIGRALLSSIALGFRNFLKLFGLILMPMAVYLPVTFLRSYSPNLVIKLFPEVSLYIVGLGIVAAAFVECFIIVCATHFLLIRDKVGSSVSATGATAAEEQSQ